MLGLSQILCYLHRVGCPYHSKTRCLWRRNRLFLGSKNLDIINKSSKSFDANANLSDASFENTNGETVRKTGWYMSADAFSTSTPKPRAEGSNPSAPATDLARNSLEFRAFLVFWGGGLRSTMPLSMACVLRFFRFCSYPFLAFPSGTSSINHQKSGVRSPVLACSC